MFFPVICWGQGRKKIAACELNSTEEVGPVKKPIVQGEQKSAKENI
jgi:hypothetical protein